VKIDDGFDLGISLHLERPLWYFDY